MDVLISGAGVAGHALAYWLRHHGFTPTVVERAPRVRAGGGAVGFRGEALDVLDRMALLERVKALNPQILRGELIGLLHEATCQEVEYVFGDSIDALEQDADGVRVTFERGRPRRFALVTGADGLHSRTRSLVFGPHERFVRHLGLYTATFGLPDCPGLCDAGRLHSGPGKEADISSTPGKPGARVALHFASGPLAYDHDDVGQHKRIVAGQFAGESGQVPRLLEEMSGAEGFFFDVNAQVEMDCWSSGRVVLVGDAGCCAAPASGLGASQALIGAYVLAGELAVAGGDHAVAFAAYEREMRGFVAEHQQMGREGADRFFMGTPIQEELGLVAANAPEAAACAQIVRLKDYAPRFAAQWP
ncbi:FAD-dependent monooxygenase [Nonomuraea sp. SBT364]|uniref:FAD-dependent monooxygenase n=1 Tax=Nonomuraea sp. SBT364 TaxID=1580530 RepID=UPI000AB8B64A|nr:FAD-dependent monooxygenase [Nonomuraea sp. SBT364]